MRQPRRVCPICGASLPVSSIRMHVASYRCLVRYDGRGSYADPRGEEAHALAKRLDHLLLAEEAPWRNS